MHICKLMHKVLCGIGKRTGNAIQYKCRTMLYRELYLSSDIQLPENVLRRTYYDRRASAGERVTAKGRETADDGIDLLGVGGQSSVWYSIVCPS